MTQSHTCEKAPVLPADDRLAGQQPGDEGTQAQPCDEGVLSSVKRRNYARYVLSLLEQGPTAHNTPLEFFLESANACNLNCKFCALHVKQDRVKGVDGIMPTDLMDAVLPWLRGAASVSLHGFGEPLMNPRLVASAAAAADCGAFVEFFTNGRMLTEERARALVKAKVARIFISISSADPQKYEYFYERGRFDKLARNLEALRDLKQQERTSSPEIHFNAIALRSTLPELVDLVEFAARVGAAGVHLKPLVTYETNPKIHAESVFYDAERDEPVLQEAELRAQELGLALYVGAYRSTCAPACKHEPVPKGRAHTVNTAQPEQVCASPLEAPPLRLERPCPLIYRTMYVTAKGETKPCCFGSASPELSLGNVREQGIEGIWNGARYRALREAHQRGEVPPLCEHCVRFNLAPPSDATAEWLGRQGFGVTNYQEIVNATAASGQAIERLAKATRQWLDDGCERRAFRAVMAQIRVCDTVLGTLARVLGEEPLLDGPLGQVDLVKRLMQDLTEAIDRAAEPPTAEELSEAMRGSLLPVLDFWPQLADDLAAAYYESQRLAADLPELH